MHESANNRTDRTRNMPSRDNMPVPDRVPDHVPDHGTDHAPVTLQRLILPDPAICTETDLFVHLGPQAHLSPAMDGVLFLPGGTASFDTYMNLFNLGTWTGACRLNGLQLRLAGTGRFELQIRQAVAATGDDRVLLTDVITLDPAGVVTDLARLLQPGTDAFGITPMAGLIMLRLTALTEGRLTGGSFETDASAPLRPLSLAISVTTFRREADVALTAARVTAFLDGEGAPLLAAAGLRAHLFIVDNGQSATPAPHPHLTLIPNANLGGAGGFARGLAAAQDGGFSHCLFMDDDAAFLMENLVRTAAFLQLARSPRAAVSGAMISSGRPWAMWENGAVFDRLCRPQFVGTDLREPTEVTAMELAAAAPKPPGFYGGWWYFAFPVDQVRRFPFPFFVRGDDISFSLVHRFETATLNGVVSFQEDFSAKESPLTLYLDLRNHLHHHMVHEGMEIGATGTARIVLRFLLRSIVRMHYDSGEAQLMAWEDVMEGPAFFADNADMTAKRPAVTALIRTESWKPVTPADMALPALVDTPPGPAVSRVLKYLINGHLVPLWRLWGSEVRIPLSHRGLIWPFWGRKTACFTNADESRAYTVRHDKARAYGLIWRAFRMYLRWRRDYPALSRAHRDSYATLASRPFWEERFLGAPVPMQTIPVQKTLAPMTFAQDGPDAPG
jgi:galactofuranosylgalactofuranosylrhamnosyl-N-acetylglucosaminyl-diphospho-decaprenol beta-1,5/1,6-galactofuranosyltransferase